MSDLEIYRVQGFGNDLGVGRRPALLVVDFTAGFADPTVLGGGNIVPAIRNTLGLLQFFRDRRLPVAFSRIVYAADGSDAGVFAKKVPALLRLTETDPLSQIVPELAPARGELVVRKTQASSFFATGLGSWLVGRSVDTLVVAGCTTSGCVRATVVDAASWNFVPIVVEDCVGDRAIGPHEANLFDMGQKYAVVMSRERVLAEVAAAA